MQGGSVTYIPEVLAEGLLAFFELDNNYLKFRNQARFIAGSFHLKGVAKNVSEGQNDTGIRSSKECFLQHWREHPCASIYPQQLLLILIPNLFYWTVFMSNFRAHRICI